MNTDRHITTKQDSRTSGGAAEASFRLVIAGAGTGGHLFPGIAVAEDLMDRLPASRVVFVTTGRDIERTVLSGRPFDTVQISAAGIKGKGLFKKLASFLVLPKGLMQSLVLLMRFSPHAVLGMGAYSSAPVILAAFLTGTPRFLHEQNRLAGMTNRWLSRFADRVFVSFADTKPGCREDRIRFTGNPVRGHIRARAQNRRQKTEKEKSSPFTILVLGGSQGAHSINMAVTEAFSYLEQPGDYYVIHQTGTRDEETVRRAYAESGVDATVSAFFGDMASVYGAADLAVCRAGATTVAEIAAMGLPAIFIPYPHAADDHQVANAEGLASAGAAEIIPEKQLSGHMLADCLAAYKNDFSMLEKARAAAVEEGRIDSAAAIVDDMIKAAGFTKESGKG